MSLKTNALWTMAKRYQEAAANEIDLLEAEKLTAKAVEYYNTWEKACLN
jgi:hypothetical protein